MNSLRASAGLRVLGFLKALVPEFVPSEIALSSGLEAPVLRDHLISARTMALRRLILESRFRQTAIAA